MTYKNSRTVIVTHILLIIFFSVVLVIVILAQNMLFVPVMTAVLLTAAIMSLMRYLERSTRDLTRALLIVREQIYMDATKGEATGIERIGFNDTLKEITREFGKLALEKELNYQYLKTLNETIAAGIIALNSDGSVRMINPAARKLLGIQGAFYLRTLQRTHPILHERVENMKPGRSEMVRINKGDEEVSISIEMRELRQQEERIRIFVLQNISRALDEKEVEAWQQLTSVLTHEIMNSVTPISSLARAAQSILEQKHGTDNELTEENLEDIADSIDTIAARSSNLLKFVNSYRAFTKPVNLRTEETDLRIVLRRLFLLLRPQAEAASISFELVLPEYPVVVNIDIAHAEQAVINLIKNALEALDHAEAGEVAIRLQERGDHAVVTISDNGPGIKEELLPKIFIPFFTTKTAGSGVGLSLTRQIILSHGGSIKVRSLEGRGTTFILEWPK